MATEAPCIPNHSQNKNKDVDGKLSRLDVAVEKSSDDENDVCQMAFSSTRKRQRKINSDDEDEIDRKTSITESVEDETICSSPEIVRSSSKRKLKISHVEDSSDSEDSGEDLPVVGRGAAFRRVKKNLDEAFEQNEVEDNTCGNVWPPDGNNCTASAKKAKKQKALESLRKKRERQAGELSDKTSLDDEYNNEGSVTPKSFTEEEEDEEESGSDMDDFVVEDSQSQELPVFAKPDLDEAYKRLVQILLCSILDNDFLSLLHDKEDPYFDEAKCAIEKAIESKKNLVGSTTWKEFKKSLEKCSIFKIQAIKPKKTQAIKPKKTQAIKPKNAAKCEACRRPRTLTKHIKFDSADCSGSTEPPSKMEFSVGRFCAQRGSLYHDLHHHCSHLKQSCIDKINKVRETMPTASDENIVECCIHDEDWLNIVSFHSSCNFWKLSMPCNTVFSTQQLDLLCWRRT